jgi:hypothetical protein
LSEAKVLLKEMRFFPDGMLRDHVFQNYIQHLGQPLLITSSSK